MRRVLSVAPTVIAPAAQPGDPIAEVGVVVGPGVDDGDARRRPEEPGPPNGRNVECGNALVEKGIDRLRRARHETGGGQLAKEWLLPFGRHVEDDDAGAAVRLPDPAAVAPEQ